MDENANRKIRKHFIELDIFAQVLIKTLLIGSTFGTTEGYSTGDKMDKRDEESTGSDIMDCNLLLNLM